MNSLARRQRFPEIMDQPDLEASRHDQALRGLSRLNWLSGTVPLMWAAIRRHARRTSQPRLRVLDLATGGGDIPLGLWRHARRSGLQLELTGLDISERAVAFARERAERAGAAVRFERGDALRWDEMGAAGGGVDAILCSLFLHHLATPDALQLLRRLARSSAGLLLINDLRRSRVNYLLVNAAARLVTSSEVVHTDGPLSVRAAFNRRELRQLAQEAGWHGARLRWSGPCRMMLQWSRVG